MNSTDNFDENENEENEENVDETKLNDRLETGGEDEDEEDNESYDEVLSQSGATKEISAPYSVPHYPIEVEELRKQMALKELEERISHLADDQSIVFLWHSVEIVINCTLLSITLIIL